jgi:hypothetical protein
MPDSSPASSRPTPSLHPGSTAQPRALAAAGTSRAATARRAILALAGALATASLLAAPAAGQGTEYSGVLGATFPTLRGADGLSSRSGSMAGLRIVRPLGGPLAFQPEFLVVNRGADGRSDFFEGEGIELDAVEVPLLLRFALSPRGPITPHLYGGPYLALHVSCTLEGTSTDCDDTPGISTRTVDVGALAGSGVTLSAGPLLVGGGLRYGFGISSLAEFELDGAREEARHGAWSIYLSAGFRF